MIVVSFSYRLFLPLQDRSRNITRGGLVQYKNINTITNMFIGDKNRLWIYKCIDLPRRFLLFWDPMKNSYGGQVNQPADGLPVSVFRLYFVVFPAPFSQFANIVSLEFVLL